MVRMASLACCKYSVKDGTGVKRERAMGEPNPRLPTGGNLALSTISRACAAERSNGTRICTFGQVLPRFYTYVKTYSMSASI